MVEQVKKQVKRVGILSEVDAKIYNLTKTEALEILKKEEVTESEQMLNKWCRDDVIDAVFISKGHPKGRGLRINSKSLEAFVQSKKGNVEDLLKQLDREKAEVERLKQELREVRKELNELKKSGVKVEKKNEVKLTDVSLSIDNLEMTFKLNRAIHRALFGVEGKLLEVKKNGRGKTQTDVLESLTEEEKEAIIKERNEKIKTEGE